MIGLRALVVSGLAVVSACVWPCCGVSSRGPVAFAGQANIVVWNSRTKTEHFVRNAQFQTVGKDLGFIAPSPTLPELSEVDPKAFQTLAALGPVRKSRGGFALGGGGGVSAGAPRVEVVYTQRVAGYDATVLLANDTAALEKWLKENGYTAPPDVQAWTEQYVRTGWYLTAFKVSQVEGAMQTGALRMSFRTNYPFNPYSVPKSNWVKPGQSPLRLFFVSDRLYTGKFGGKRPWVAPTWTAPVTKDTAQVLDAQLKVRLGSVPEGVVACFNDREFASYAESDLFFEPSTSRVGSVSLSDPSMAFLSYFVR